LVIWRERGREGRREGGGERGYCNSSCEQLKKHIHALQQGEKGRGEGREGGVPSLYLLEEGGVPPSTS
jgi:hypothetical protein